MAMVTRRTEPRYVLIIEDNVHHAELLTEVLDRHFAPVIIHTVDTIEDGVEFASQSSYDLILTAGVIGASPTVGAILKLRRSAGGIPIVVISGRGDEKLAAEFIKSGATEYLSKTRETLENLSALLEKHLMQRRAGRGPRPGARRDESQMPSPSPAALVREVDRLTQEALAIAGPRRRKRRSSQSPEIEQLDRLLSQIKRLREIASKLAPK